MSNLESRDSVRLVAAIGCVLSSMPVKDLVGPLEALVGSRVESIQVRRITCIFLLSQDITVLVCYSEFSFL